MVWYPSVDDVIDMNIHALDLSGDKHPHKMLGSASGIQAILDNAKTKENKGLTYQAAFLMKALVAAHIFAGAHHRTAYGVAKMFLRRNGRRLKVNDFSAAYPFIIHIGTKTVKEIQEWIEHGTSEEP